MRQGPTRAALLTGRYQQRFGHEFNGPNRPVAGFSMSDMGLDPNEVTIGEAMQALGYRHMAAVLRGEAGLAEAVEKMKRDTRQYAKRQMTFFSSLPDVQWISPDETGVIESLVSTFFFG